MNISDHDKVLEVKRRKNILKQIQNILREWQILQVGLENIKCFL